MKKNLVVIATANAGKVREFLHILGDDLFEFRTLQDVGFHDAIVEDADTFRGNAEIKARTVGAAVFARYPGCAVLADDSGLEVQALHGAPGVFTARFAGSGASDEDNYQKLLNDLRNHQNRRARFFCCLCFWQEGGEPQFFEGDCPGTILEQPTGSQGFGYDPVFSPDNGDGRSFAQMTHAEKKALSHRGEAIRRFREWILGISSHK